MKIKPIARSFRSFDRDERQDAEERRYELIIQLLSEMDVPKMRYEDLLVPEKRAAALRWLTRNLEIYNSHHKNYQRVKNLIHLSLKCKR